MIIKLGSIDYSTRMEKFEETGLKVEVPLIGDVSGGSCLLFRFHFALVSLYLLDFLSGIAIVE